MERILLVLDSVNMDLQPLDFACWLAELSRSHITGVFIENKIPSQALLLQEAGTTHSLALQPDKSFEKFSQRKQRQEENIALFESACKKHGIGYEICIDRGDAIMETIRKSRYADLLVIGRGIAAFANQIISDAECPVVTSPSKFEPVDEIICLYNGTASSVAAIKQFCYLLPELTEARVNILQLADLATIPERQVEDLRAWISNHFSCVGLTYTRNNRLPVHLLTKKNVLIVTDKAGRNKMTDIYLKHFTEQFLETLSMFIF